ncbi:MAG: hypothetical protein K2P81_11700 [Bacteriovoracaceae bacterium]|nr:hypothetical protein [Bacteriovoracaceae bacterium]
MNIFVLNLLLIIVSFDVNARVIIITPSELIRKIDNFIILDARESSFQDGHIPNSINFDWKNYTEERPGGINTIFGNPSNWGKVSTKKPEIEMALSRMGISNESKVVIIGQPNLWGTEGRVAWNLLYWGLQDVYLLDGGFPAWKDLKYPIVQGNENLSNKKQGKFIVTFDETRRITTSALENKHKELKLIDNRSLNEFKGEKYFGQKRAGHIPNALNIPLQTLYTGKGSFISREQFQKISPSTKLTQVSYCIGGVRSALYALLYEAYFEKKVLNYDASIWAWSSDITLPMQLK